ncbi:MAG: MFS transporter [Chloroflexi bacterium]|nr:MFS transporter [Chloroflexota bacterium]
MRWSGVGLVAGAFLVVFGLGGLRLIFGVWMRPLESDFGVDRSAISLVASLGLLVFGLGQPLLGRQVDVRGPRLIVPGSVLLTGVGVVAASLMPSYAGFVITFGMIASLGFAGAANATIVALVAQRFEQNRGLIYAICSAGGPLGQMTLASVAAAGVEAFGWRQTMLFFGVVLLAAVLPLVAVLLRGSAPPRKEPLPSLGETIRLAFRAKGFVLLWWAYFICGVTTLGLVHTHVVAYGADRGLPQISAAGILSLVGLFNIGGLILAGRIADRFGGRRPLIAAFTIRSVALLWLANATTEGQLMLFALIFGLTDMATIPFSAAATVQMFGPRMLGVLTGFLAVAHQTGAALGSYVAGRGYELFGGYPPVIIVAVGVALTGALLSFAMDTRPVRYGASAGTTGLAPTGA